MVAASVIPAPVQDVRFVPGRDGMLFEVRSTPEGAAPGTVPATVLVAPIGEEMNRARRLLARVRRALARAGHLCVHVDLHGTGDSEGDFADARWETWLEDLGRLVSGIHRDGAASVSFVGVRSGALLADALARTGGPLDALVLVQPETSGEAFVRRALRTRIAANALVRDAGERPARETIESLWGRFECGDTLELGGYSMASPLALALRAARVEPGPPPGVGEAWWIEIGEGARAPEGWRHRTVEGRRFWQLHDAPVPEPLVEAVVEACAGQGR